MADEIDPLEYVKQHHKQLVREHCDTAKYPPSDKPITFFMAGSPGAGETEYSIAFIERHDAEFPDQKIIRLDVDEFRSLIPGYCGSNSDKFQPACSKLLTKMCDFVIISRQNAFIDGTFSSPDSLAYLERSLRHGRTVGIVYLYQDPIIAWDYTKKREKLEGRTVPKEVFVKGYFESRENVNAAKMRFAEKVKLDLVIKKADNSFEDTYFNIQSVDGYLKNEAYTYNTLMELLPDSID